jgi:hypothetical protein
MPQDHRSQFVRLGELDRSPAIIWVDEQPVHAMAGDTLLVAVLSAQPSLRLSEFGDGRRAGFCLMGACQDCWMWTEQGTRVRACTTAVQNGLRVLTQPREDLWPRRA